MCWVWYEMSDATCSQDLGCGRGFPAGRTMGSLKNDDQGSVHLPVFAQGFGTSVATPRCFHVVPWRQIVIFIYGIQRGDEPGHNAPLVSSI